MGWLYFLFIDYPVRYLWGPLDSVLTKLPDVPFLPSIAANWSAFLGPLLLFGIVGTLMWFCVGWLLGRGYVFLRKPSHLTNRCS
jgi:hypothetical protein